MKTHAEETHVLSSSILKNSSRHHHLQSIQGERFYLFSSMESFILGGQSCFGISLEVLFIILSSPLVESIDA